MRRSDLAPRDIKIAAELGTLKTSIENIESRIEVCRRSAIDFNRQALDEDARGHAGLYSEVSTFLEDTVSYLVDAKSALEQAEEIMGEGDPEEYV